MTARYAAVGRRLGYPLKLVAARGPNYGHFFVRWDDPHGERFNIEVNNHGLDCPSDDQYRQGFYQTRPDWEQSGSILKSMTPREELAAFMVQRTGCLGDEGRMRHKAEAYAWAIALAPHNVLHRAFLNLTLDEWHRQLQEQKPQGFPEYLDIRYPPRRFPASLPVDFERHIVGLTITEFMLKDSTVNQDLWEPMRRGAVLPGKLTRIEVDCTKQGYDVRMCWS